MRWGLPLLAITLGLVGRVAAGEPLPVIDISRQPERRVVVDRVDGAYLGQPDTVLLGDGRTMLVGYPEGHGGPNTSLKRSTDGGRTWSDRLSVPESFTGDHNAPSIHRLVGPDGKARLVLFVSYPVMKHAISEDGGETWSELEPIFGEEMKGEPGYKGHAPPKSVIRRNDGRHVAFYHDHYRHNGVKRVEVMRIVSDDGGRTWGEPERISRHPDFPGAEPCEPAVVRVKDGERLLCLCRENSRQYNSMWMVSDDEGRTWSKLRELPDPLTGDRHVARRTDDGRLVVTFRDRMEGARTYGDFVMWVGTAEDIVEGRRGEYRVRLLDNRAGPGETGYAGLERLPDGTFVSTTYCDLSDDGERDPVVVSVRFTMAELDRLAAAGEKTGYDIPLIDLNDHEDRQVVVDREAGQYLGHPSTVLLDDGRTLVAVYPKGHGDGAIVLKRSTDGGRTWSDRLPVPDNWATSKETPTIHKVTGPDGNDRLVLFSGLYPVRMAVSEDGGRTWTPLKPVGDWGGIVTMGSVVPRKTGQGHYLAMFHDDGRFFTADGERTDTFTLYQTFSEDGGLTWSEPETIYSSERVHLCEPGVIRSPDGGKLAALLRENRRVENSHVMFSTDEGESWSLPREVPGALTGDRHQGGYGPDGRLFLSFRDTTLDSPTHGDWVGWVGRWRDIVEGREGQYRVRLKDNHKGADCGYPGVEVLPDGTFVVTTYGHWEKGKAPYIMSVRFRLEELDELAKESK